MKQNGTIVCDFTCSIKYAIDNIENVETVVVTNVIGGNKKQISLPLWTVPDDYEYSDDDNSDDNSENIAE